MLLGKLEYLMAKSVFMCFPSFILRVLACDHVAAPNMHASFPAGSARSSLILSSDQRVKVLLSLPTAVSLWGLPPAGHLSPAVTPPAPSSHVLWTLDI